MTNAIIGAHDFTSAGKTSQSTEPSVIAETQHDAVGYQRAGHLIRRLRVVLADLGLDGTVPGGWASPTSCGVSFRDLTQRQANYLVRTLEDLAVDRAPDLAGPGPDQLSLFEVGR